MERRSRVCSLTVSWFWLLAQAVSAAVHTWSGVGLEAVLPCTWKTQVVDFPQSPYIQWETVTRRVFERKGEQVFQGESFQDRVDVPKEVLEEGNCSLLLTDVQFSDAGIYESYLVVGQARSKKRIFLQSVQLLVFDHKLVRSVERGEDLVLDLYTSHAKTLVFESPEAPGWSQLWQRGAKRDRGSRLVEREGSLVLQGVRPSDSGTYRVLDSEGLALSTVKVTITDPVPTQSPEVLERKSLLGGVSVNTPALALPGFLLLSALLMFF